MKLWLRYLNEKRRILFLYLTTVFLFVAVGTLYHIENLEKLLYAALLTSVVWGAAGFLGGVKYVAKSRQLEAAIKHFENAGELRPEEAFGLKIEEAESAETLMDACFFLLQRVLDAHQAEAEGWAEKDRESRDYYAMWTHQIKTPIQAMKLLLEKMEYCGREGFLMREELFKIEQYVGMVLGFQRLKGIAMDLVLQEYVLYDLVKQVVKKDSVLFINKGIGLELEKMEYKVLTDEKWFTFCVEQLLSNSIKYTPHGKIRIWGEEKEDKVKLYIEDTGIGIRPEDLPRIFERGFTGCNGRLEKKSTGIGLYLCRQIFRHLGIAAQVESEEGKGTKVIMIIPHTKM